MSERHGRAGRTGWGRAESRESGQSATTAAEAEEAFGDRLAVLDGDPLRDQSGPHGSSTMVLVSRDDDLTVTRPGINNSVFAQDLTGYASCLAARWRARSLSTAGLGGAAVNADA